MKKLCFFLILLMLAIPFSSVKASPDGWVSPTGHSDPDNDWTSEPNAYDENEGTGCFASCDLFSPKTTGWLYLTVDEITSHTLRCLFSDNGANSIIVEVHLDSSWEEIYNDPNCPVGWFNLTYSGQGQVDSMRIQVSFPAGFMYSFSVVEVDFWEVEAGPSEYNFSGSISVRPAVSSKLTWSFSRYGDLSQQVTTDSSMFVNVLRNFFGSITGLVGVSSEKTTLFNWFSTLNPTFTINSFTDCFGANILNLYGAITQKIGATSKVAVEWGFLTSALALVSFVISFVALPLLHRKTNRLLIFALFSVSITCAIAAVTLPNLYVAVLAFTLSIITLTLTITKREEKHGIEEFIP